MYNIYIHIHICLVVGIPTPLKNMKISWDYDTPNIWKVIKIHGSKAPLWYVWTWTKHPHFILDQSTLPRKMTDPAIAHWL
jgi:hypothetical protein